MIKYISSFLYLIFIAHIAMSHELDDASLVARLGEKNFSITIALQKSEQKEWSCQLWSTILWGNELCENNFVKKVLFTKSNVELQESIARASCTNYRNQSQRSTIYELPSLQCCYNFAVFARGILLPQMAIAARDGDWEFFIKLYREILFTIPTNSDFYDFAIAPLALIIPQFVRYSTPPISVFERMEKDLVVQIKQVECQQISPLNRLSITKKVLRLYAIKTNLRLGKQYSLTHCWPEVFEHGTIFNASTHGRIEYSLKNGQWRYKMNLADPYDTCYAVSESFSGRPVSTAGFLSEAERIALCSSLGQWIALRIVKCNN